MPKPKEDGTTDDVDILDVAPEDFDGSLSEEQSKAIKDDMDKPWDDEESDQEDDSSTDKDVKKPKVEDSEKKDGEDDSDDNDDSDKDDDETSDDSDDELTDEQKEEARIKKGAEDEGMTIDEFKADEDKDTSIAERHGNDPKKIARALRKEQSQYSKLKNDNEKLAEFKSNVENQYKVLNETKFQEACEAKREEFVEKYVKFHPEQEDESEEILFERAKNEIRATIKNGDDKKQADMNAKATERRTAIIEAIDDDFKEVLPEIKAVLKVVSNSEVVKDDFDIAYIANYARGKKYTPEYVKTLIKDAEKRGKAEFKIKDKNNIPRGGGGGGKGSKAGLALSESEKTRAMEIYGNRGWTAEKVFNTFSENDKGKDFDD